MSGGIRRLHVALAALILSTTGLIEWASGRPLLCPCGHVGLWTGTVHGPENS